MVTDVTEIKKLAADLTKAGPVAQTKAALIVKKAAVDIEARAKIQAPVDTGNLRNSIGNTWQGMTAEIGPSAHYGKYVEFGTSRMRPQPYLRPAVDAVTPGFLKACKQLGGEIL